MVVVGQPSDDFFVDTGVDITQVLDHSPVDLGVLVEADLLTLSVDPGQRSLRDAALDLLWVDDLVDAEGLQQNPELLIRQVPKRRKQLI